MSPFTEATVITLKTYPTLINGEAITQSVVDDDNYRVYIEIDSTGHDLDLD